MGPWPQLLQVLLLPGYLRWLQEARDHPTSASAHRGPGKTWWWATLPLPLSPVCYSNHLLGWAFTPAIAAWPVFPRQEDVPLIFRFKLHITHNQPEPHLNYAGSFHKSIHSQFFGDQNEVVPRFLCVTAIEFFKDFMAWRLGYFLKSVFKRRRQAWVKVKLFLYEDIWSFILLVSAT